MMTVTCSHEWVLLVNLLIVCVAGYDDINEAQEQLLQTLSTEGRPKPVEGEGA